MIILANPRSDWNVLRPLLFESIGQTLTMVLVTLVIGGFLGLILGVVLYTRPGNLFENAVVYRILDIIVNIVRPIPFIIFLIHSCSFHYAALHINTSCFNVQCFHLQHDLLHQVVDDIIKITVHITARCPDMTATTEKDRNLCHVDIRA